MTTETTKRVDDVLRQEASRVPQWPASSLDVNAYLQAVAGDLMEAFAAREPSYYVSATDAEMFEKFWKYFTSCELPDRLGASYTDRRRLQLTDWGKSELIILFTAAEPEITRRQREKELLTQTCPNLSIAVFSYRYS